MSEQILWICPETFWNGYVCTYVFVLLGSAFMQYSRHAMDLVHVNSCRVTHSSILGKTHRLLDIFVENVPFHWFKRYVFTWEHFQSDPGTFRFDFMFVKPRDVPSMFCFNVQTDMAFYCNRFWHQTFLLQQILSPEGRRCNTFGVIISVCTLKQNIGSTSCGFTHIKSNQNMSRSDWKCSSVHKYRLNHSKTWISGGGGCIFPRWANGLPSVI